MQEKIPEMSMKEMMNKIKGILKLFSHLPSPQADITNNLYFCFNSKFIVIVFKVFNSFDPLSIRLDSQVNYREIHNSVYWSFFAGNVGFPFF